MIPISAVYQDPHVSCLLKMHPGDRFRDGHVISYQYPARLFTHPTEILTKLGAPLILAVWSIFVRAVNWIRDVYEAYQITGRLILIETSPIVDEAEFKKVFPKLRGRIQNLHDRFQHRNEKTLEAFAELKHLMKIYTKLRLSWAGKYLKADSNNSFNELRAELKELREIATLLVQEWTKERPVLERINLRRWIESTSFQRKFASWYDDEELPWRADELPAGCILLTDMEKDAVGHWIQEHRLTPWQQFKRVQAQGAGVLTGNAVAHAALCLGDRKIFHIDKLNGDLFHGQGVFEQYRGEKSLHRYQIMAPNVKENLIREVVRQAEDSGANMHANAGSILGVTLARKREQGYTYQPNDSRLYACSSAVADLFYRAGVDIGAHNGIKIEKFSPADFLTSDKFHPWTERDLAAPDLTKLSPEVRDRVHYLIWEKMGRPQGPGTHDIGRREAYADIPRLKEAFYEAQN